MIHIETRRFAELLMPGDRISLNADVSLDGTKLAGPILETVPIPHMINRVGIIEWDTEKRTCTLYTHKREKLKELPFSRETMLTFTKQGNLFLAHSDRFKDVVGSGLSKVEAEADFHERVANGWHEARRKRLIAAIRAGLTAREQLARTGEERARADADRADLENFIRMIARNDLIAITEL